MHVSRTRYSARNAITALSFFLINVILQFISRRVFIQYLGSDILGLNSTVVSLLQFLNLAELGISTAIAFTLYRPIADGDRRTIMELLALQRWFYQRVALIMLISGIILSLFFPLIFDKAGLPLWYAYSTFGVLLFSALLSYIFNYHQILLSAHQLEYKVTIATRLPNAIKDLLQIISIWRLPEYGYLLWIVWEGIGAIVRTLVITHAVRREFPLLYGIKLNGGRLRHAYPEIMKKVGQAFFHKIGGFVLLQVSPLIIYAYLNLNTVAIYGNYMLLIQGITSLMATLFNGMGASVGNLIHSSTTERLMSVFREMYLLRFLLTISFCFGYRVCITPLTILWVGEEYLLPNHTVVLMILIAFFNIMRQPVQIFLEAHGILADIWSSIGEVIVNISLSLLLGYYWGLDGILIGVMASLFIFIFCWKPYYLLVRNLKVGLKSHLLLIFKLLMIAIPLFIAGSRLTISLTSVLSATPAVNLLIGIGATVIFTLLLYAIFYFTEPATSQITRRLLTLLPGNHSSAGQ